MAKILEFKTKEAQYSDTYSPHGDETLSFGAKSDGSIDLNSDISAVLGDLSIRRDWTNQELADLYRVCHLLNSAKIHVETDRGIAEDGDPWFVFCSENGEVFIHLCRIDGMYILDCANLSAPLKGRNFRELIADFTDKLAVPKTSDSHAGHVIHLERSQKLSLHPSAMMAALIWTLFLASEELVLVVPETDTDETIDLQDLETVYSAELPESVDHPRLQDDGFAKEDSAKLASPVFTEEMMSTVHRDSNAQVYSLSPSAFTIGLSSIAVALGFLNEQVHLRLEKGLVQALQDFDARFLESVAVQNAELAASKASEIDAVTVVDVTDGLETSKDMADLDQVMLVSDTHSVALDAVQADQIVSQMSVTRSKIASTRDAEKNVIALETEPVIPHDVEQQDDAAALLQTQEEGEVSILLSLMSALDAPMSEIKLSHVTIKSADSLLEFDGKGLFDWISAPSLDESENLWQLDTTAVRLIDFLEAKDGDIYYLTTSNGVVIIDVTAKTGGETATLYWEADDGQVISFVGLAADFEEFNLVA